MAGRLHKWGCPLLPVLVVSVDTGMPSETVYRRFGLVGAAATRSEQQKVLRCRLAWILFRPDLEGR